MRTRLQVDPRIRGSLAEMLAPSVVVRVTDFNEAGAKAFREDMERANQSSQPIIPVVIDSYGGEVYSLLDMVSQIQSSRAPVATIVEGKAMSAGAMLFTMGQQRFMAQHATLMLHDVSSMTCGKIAELKSSVVEAERLQTLIFGMIAANVGRPADYFTDILHAKSHAEWFLTAKEARKHNLCTRIGVPELVCEVGVKYTFR